MKRIITLWLTLSVLCVQAWAVNVKVTMNSVAMTMTLTDSKGAQVNVGSPVSYNYSFSVDEGEYVLNGFDRSGVSVGTITLTIDESNNEFKVWTASFKANNSGWTYGKDYVVTDCSMRSRDGKAYPITIGAGNDKALVLNGGSFNCTFTPSAARASEGYTEAYGSATFTGNASCNAALPLGGLYTVSFPADAHFQLMRKLGGTNGSGSIHYVPFSPIQPLSEVTGKGITTRTYVLGEANTYNYRLWREGGRTKAGVFPFYSGNDGKVYAGNTSVMSFTDADLAADPKMINHDVKANGVYNVANILLNINERGHLRMAVGETKNLLAQRDWQLVNTSTANYFIEPDYHYSVVNLEGAPVRIDNADTSTDAWPTLTAQGRGTAIVLVTYDAMQVTMTERKGSGTDASPYTIQESGFLGGRDWSALWPENTGVFVVTVGDNAPAADPNMVINEQYDQAASKVAGKYVDAEHDVFYYLDTEEGYTYTFLPSGVEKVEVAYPTILANGVNYDKGFVPVPVNADGSYSLLLKHGRQIVRMTDANGVATYQVLNAKPVHREVANLSRKGSAIFQPGDRVKVQYSGLYHPANKMSGIYNMSAYITYNNIPTGTELTLGSNQYNFAGTPAAQAVTLTIGEDWDAVQEPQLTLAHGVLQVTGFGDPIGNHRYIDKVAGRSPNFTAVSHKTYFGALPDVSIPITPAIYFAVNLSTNVEDAAVTLCDAGGRVLTPAADGYRLTYGTYSYLASADGYGKAAGVFTIAEGDPQSREVSIVLARIPGNGWDGSTLSCPPSLDGVYQISTGAELAWFASEVNVSKNYTAKAVLTCDVDLCNFNWNPIGGSTSTKAFKGSFDGQGHTVKGLYIDNKSTYQGLFGYAQSADVRNLTVEGRVTTTGNYAAGVVAYANGCSITRCVSRVALSGKQYVGGIASYAAGATSVEACGNEGSVRADGLTTAVKSNYAAGIVGYLAAATGTIVDCYNTGSIEGQGCVAGIVANTHADAVVVSNLNMGDVWSDGKTSGNVRAVATVANNTAGNYVLCHYDFGLDYETVVSPGQLASGEVAYMLNKGVCDGTQRWYQTIGEDAYPVLDATHGSISLQEHIVSIGSVGYSTICLGYDAVVPADLKAYVVGRLTSSAMVLVEVDSIRAGEGYVLKGESGSYLFRQVFGIASAPVDNLLEGVLADTDISQLPGYDYDYVLALGRGSKDRSVIGFFSYRGRLGANKAFLRASHLSAAAAQGGMRMVTEEEADDDATAIDSLAGTPSADALYDLMGRRVAVPRRGGLYIRSGRKVNF